MENLLLLQADALELDFGVQILENLVGESLTHKGQSVRLFDQTTRTAEVFYPGGHNGKPAIHNHSDGSHWFPLQAYMEWHGLNWKQAVTRLADQYLGDGVTVDIAKRIQQQTRQKEQQQQAPPSLHDAATVARSLNPQHYASNYFARYLRRLFGQPVADDLLQRFNVGTTHWHRCGTVFWQQDTQGNYRAGKIIAYSEPTGKRRKEDEFIPRWAHDVQRLPDFHLIQCLFGEHQLPARPDTSVGIVESEKTAIVLTALIPSIVWLATGGQQNLGLIERCQALRGRVITLWPDLDPKFECYTLWEKRAEGLSRLGFDVAVSQLLRDNATVANRQDKMDVADFLTGPEKRCPETGRLLSDDGYPQLWDVADPMPRRYSSVLQCNDETRQLPALIVRDEPPVNAPLIQEVAVSSADQHEQQSPLDRMVSRNSALAQLVSTLDLVFIPTPPEPARYIYVTGQPSLTVARSKFVVRHGAAISQPVVGYPDQTFHQWQQAHPYFSQMGIASIRSSNAA